MTKRLNIGVLTFHNCINYGSYWQARCLVEGLRAQGHDAELLDHRSRHVAWAEARCAFQPSLPERTARGDMRPYARKVRKFIDAFAGLRLSRPFPLDAPEAADSYDAIIVGSDEVWNLAHPWYGGKPIFYGVGLNAPRLVSYAASFGSYSCHWGMDEFWAKQLNRFDRVSVRDENSYWLVRGVTGREPEIVLDPCLQFPEATTVPAAEAERPYALVYGHSFPDWFGRAARRWADSARVQQLSVGYRNGFADVQRLDAGPIEFASLVAGSQAMLTNFFHGCVFSLLNAKPFATVTSEYRANKVRGLAQLVGAGHRIVHEDTPDGEYRRLLEMPPLPHVRQKLADHRERSNLYLDAVLA